MFSNIKYRLTVLTVLWLLLPPQLAGSEKEYNVKALFVYNFIKYIEWPSDKSEIKIGVLGNSPIYTPLAVITARKSTEEKHLMLTEIKQPRDAARLDILFVPRAAGDRLPEILQAARAKPVLIITESKGAARRGAGINFTLKDGRIRFEINRKALKRAGLEASSQLLKLAILIR